MHLKHHQTCETSQPVNVTNPLCRNPRHLCSFGSDILPVVSQRIAVSIQPGSPSRLRVNKSPTPASAAFGDGA